MNIKNFTVISFFAYGLIYLFLLTSCDNGPEPRTMLRFASGSNYTTDSQNVTGGQIISSSLYGQTGGSTTLKRFTIRYIYDKKDTATYLDSTLQSNEFGMVFNFGTRGVKGRETWIFTLYDSENKTYTRQYTLRTTGNNQPFHTYSTTYFKRSALENLRYFKPNDGTVYPAYFIRNINHDTIRSKVAFYVDRSTVNDTLINLNSFNNTSLRQTNLANLDAVRTIADIKAAYDNGSEVTAVTNFGESRVVAFKTQAGKHGLIGNFTFDKLISNTSGSPRKSLRQVRYTVKVER